ncbi:MAG: hypothetical protein ACREEM_46490, partial [Blastocatellia bacterium]
VLKGAFLRADKSVVEIENTHGRQSIRLEKVKSIRFDRSKLAVSERKSSAPYSGLNFQIPAPDIQSTPDVSNQGTSRETRPTYSRKSSRARSYRTYIRGPRGGCYYINGNGNKTYVDRSLCQ